MDTAFTNLIARFSSAGPGELPVDGDENRTLHVISGLPGTPTDWTCRSLARNFLEVEDEKKGKNILKKHLGKAQDFHRRLWPGQEPGEIHGLVEEPEGSGSKSLQLSCMDTRLMLSFLGHMLSYQKRSSQLRFRTFQMLKALVEAVAKLGFRCQFLWFSPTGQGQWSKQTLRPGGICEPWQPDFFNQFLTMTWSANLHSDKTPWVSTPCTHVHLADFISFALDFPPELQRKVNANLRWAKQCLERTALTVLKQLGEFIEENVLSLTRPSTRLQPPRRRTGGQRINKVEKWNIVATAMQQIFLHQELSCCASHPNDAIAL